MQEYNKKYHQFDQVREELKNKANDMTMRIQMKKLEARIKNLERSHKVELRYAKERARERAENLVREKLEKMRDIFIKEVDFIQA